MNFEFKNVVVQILKFFICVYNNQRMPSRFLLTTYYNTCYTSPFLNKSGSPLVCFHPLLTFFTQMHHQQIWLGKKIKHQQHYLYEIRCIPIGRIYVGQNVNPSCRLHQHCTKLPCQMQFNISHFHPFEQYFNFNIVFKTFCTYQVDRQEQKHINKLQNIGPCK
jgi:hypothetical protein